MYINVCGSATFKSRIEDPHLIKLIAASFEVVANEMLLIHQPHFFLVTAFFNFLDLTKLRCALSDGTGSGTPIIDKLNRSLSTL